MEGEKETGVEVKRAIVFCWSDSDQVPVQISKQDYVICADCGCEYAARCGVQPDLVVGDFDSCRADAFNFGAAQKITLPVKKDDTDTFYAVEYALKQGIRQIVIAGGIGGPRIDHMFANIQVLRHIYQSGAKGYITDGRTEIRYLSDHSKLLVAYDSRITTVSFVPLIDTKNVCIQGFEYEAMHRDLKADLPLAVSNSMVEGQDGVITMEKGEALVFIVF